MFAHTDGNTQTSEKKSSSREGQEGALLGPAAWPESLLAVAERLKTDPEYKRQKVLWVERETAETSMDYFARVATQASAGKARIIWRRGGNNALGVEGASNAPPGWIRVCIQGSPFWWRPNATKQYLERRGIDVMTARMSPPRTKAQGWLLLAKSDTKDMEQDHQWYENTTQVQIPVQRGAKRRPDERKYHDTEALESRIKVPETPAQRGTKRKSLDQKYEETLSSESRIEVPETPGPRDAKRSSELQEDTEPSVNRIEVLETPGLRGVKRRRGSCWRTLRSRRAELMVLVSRTTPSGE